MPNCDDEISRIPRHDFAIAAVIFLVALAVFWLSPVSQISDSRYSLLLSENLIKHRSFALDAYNLPRLEPQAGVRDNYVANGPIWQLQLLHDHIYYYFPPGSSVLSIPFVAIANVLGYSIGNQDGTYDALAEEQLQTMLAAILMAVSCVITYLTARNVLPIAWSLTVTFVAAFGTQVWSTSSRGLWSHTWETLLVSLIVWLLVRCELRHRELHPLLLGTLVAWSYFVRPSAAVVVIAITVYVLIFHQTEARKYLVAGFVWAAVFVAYSWINFRQLVPSYFSASRLRVDLFPEAIAGNLISPSRGLFVYVPIVVFVLFLLVRYRLRITSPRLLYLSLVVIVLNVLIVSSFANRLGDWWGGASYGPRYLADLVPWWSLLSIVALDAWLRWRRYSPSYSRPRFQSQLAIGVLLAVVSIFINARGALSRETWKWTQPKTDLQMRERLWDWKHPQFLAGLQHPPPLSNPPTIRPGLVLEMGNPEVDPYLWYGWSDAEQTHRWTDGNEAAIAFTCDAWLPSRVTLIAEPFVADEINEQVIQSSLNDGPTETVSLVGTGTREFTLGLSGVRRGQNVLKFRLPNATSPRAAGIGNDTRCLALRLLSMRFE
jgi:hypothetical protein